MAKIAAVQMNCENGTPKETLKRMLDYIDEAAGQGAELVILPEGIYQGYIFYSYEEAYALAEEVPAGTLTQTLMKKAAERNVYIIAGLYEKEGLVLYNSAVLVGPEGYIGTYRKMHMWGTEKLYCDASMTGFPVFDTRLGKIGIMICYDLWFPESSRLLTLQGADLICSPTGWVKDERLVTTPDGLPIANVLCMANSHCNGVYIAAAARVGEERGTKWVANSIITDPQGAILSRAGDDKEEIIYADVDLRRAKESRNWGSRTHIIADRRRDQYDEMLGYSANPYIL